MDALADVAGVQLGVYVESQEGGSIFAGGRDARHSVVLLCVDGGECEGVFVELRVAHGCGNFGVEGGANERVTEC